MQYKADNPDDYLNALEDDWRKPALMTLRDQILALDAGMGEEIGYGMLRYTLEGESLFHLNAQKGYVALYAGNIDAIDPDGTLTGWLSRGKGCLRFSKTRPVDDPRVARFLDSALRLAKQGRRFEC